MHYSKGAATLLSTVFTLRFKTVVVADIVESSNEVLPGTDTAVNVLTSTLTSSPTSTKIKLKRKWNHSDVDVDTGILNPADTAASVMDVSSGSLTIAATTSCFYCDNGFVCGTVPNNSCYAACVAAGASCCTYTNTTSAKLFNGCSGFTGKVCMDGSCNGYKACQNANIPSVVNSCIGWLACYRAGGDGGSIGNVIDSCHGRHVCKFLGYNNGMVGNIKDSCNGEDACEYLGRKYGNVGNILNSCSGTSACEDGASYGGSIGDIMQSCSHDKACYYLEKFGGSIGNINVACTYPYASYYGGFVGDITQSCTFDDSCRDLGRGNGKVGHVTDSCTGNGSCQSTDSKHGSIGSITQSCNAANACGGAGSGSSGAITSNLTNCCSAQSGGECKGKTQATLPTTCQAPHPTSIPTKLNLSTPKPNPSQVSKVREI